MNYILFLFPFLIAFLKKFLKKGRNLSRLNISIVFVMSKNKLAHIITCFFLFSRDVLARISPIKLFYYCYHDIPIKLTEFLLILVPEPGLLAPLGPPFSDPSPASGEVVGSILIAAHCALVTPPLSEGA